MEGDEGAVGSPEPMADLLSGIELLQRQEMTSEGAMELRLNHALLVLLREIESRARPRIGGDDGPSVCTCPGSRRRE